MTLYPMALFLHVAGALGLFAVLGIEWTSLLYLRRATTAEQVQEWSKASRSGPRHAVVARVAVAEPGPLSPTLPSAWCS